VPDKTKQIETDSKKLLIEETEIAKNESNLNEIKPAYETRETLKQRAEELGKLVQIKNLEIQITGENERLEKGNKIVNETSVKVDILNTEKQKLSEFIKSQKAELPDLTVLSKVKAWHVDKQNFNKQALEINSEIKKYKLETEKISLSQSAILNAPPFNELENKTRFSGQLVFSQSQIESLKTAIKKLDSEADHLRVKAQLEKYAADLSEGSACPLCGSTHHPEIYNAENIHHEQTKIDVKKQDLEKQIEKWNDTLSTLKDLNLQMNLKTGILNDWQKKSEENKKQSAQHQSLFSWPEYVEKEKVEGAFNAAETLQKEIKQKESDLEKLTTDLEKTLKNKELYQSEIEKIRNRITVLETENKTLSGQLNLVSTKEYSNKTTSEIKAERNFLMQQFAALEKQFNEISVNLNELRKNKDTLSGIISANREVLESEKGTLDILTKQLDEQLEKSDYSTLDEVKSILLQTVNLDENKKKIADFRQNLSLAQSRFEELKTELGENVYHTETHKKLLIEIKDSKELQNTKNQEKGKTEEWLKKLKKDIENFTVLQQQLEKLELRGQNINTMKSLFKASGFVNYISSVYLQNLCNAANDRFFKLTRQKLRLEITEDNNFQVRDFLNGGKVRNVKTLSGGQTFQAALSLALALADNIQKITESNQNFFFLDEGFGSLDKESLSVVFDTLKSLRKENRIVGVISHVEEMQQEIDVHLRIENNDETGSLIVESWK
jgi:exonuclease SbcC